MCSAFCSFSYIKEKYSFTPEVIQEIAGKSVKYFNEASDKKYQFLTAEQFILDMQESVCMLQPDGLEISFVHRSFQEYFSAVLLENIQSSKVKKIVDAYVSRLSDAVFQWP